jgi:hypothetical protein
MLQTYLLLGIQFAHAITAITALIRQKQINELFADHLPKAVEVHIDISSPQLRVGYLTTSIQVIIYEGIPFLLLLTLIYVSHISKL